MNPKSIYQNATEWGKENRNSILIYSFLVLGFLFGLGLGILINQEKPSPIIIDKNVKVGLPEQSGLPDTSGKGTAALLPAGGNYVASINGEAYYPKNCAAAKRIKEENRIWFDTAQEAENQGYRPAKNCE